MSENLELVRSIFAAWGHGDFSSGEWADPEIEFVSPMGVETGTWTGRAEMANAWRTTMSAYDELRVSAAEFLELDPDRVLVLHSLSGRGKMSGIDLGRGTRQGAMLFHVRTGKVTRLVIYPDRERAFADLGLKE